MRRGECAALILLLLTPAAHAKVFDFTQAQVATYIHGQYGATDIGNTAYGNAGGVNNVFDSGPQEQFAGEAGAVIGLGRMNLVFTGEYLSPNPATDQWGGNSSGTKLMSVSSRVIAVVASVGFEFLFHQRSTSRFLFGMSGGYADVTMTNNYSMTTAGEALYTAVSSTYSENGHGSGISGKAYFGLEFLLTDNVTCTFDLGYRYLQVTNLTYSSSSTTVNGAQSEGSAIKDSNGLDRDLKMDGAYGGIGFRFYFL